MTEIKSVKQKKFRRRRARAIAQQKNSLGIKAKRRQKRPPQAARNVLRRIKRNEYKRRRQYEKVVIQQLMTELL